MKRTNFIKIISVILISTIYFSFQSDDKILWKETTKLVWDDFKGKPDASSSYKANTETEITVDVKVKNENATIILQCYFVKNLSWTKDKNNSGLLVHEQMHFNISEIGARKFRKKLKDKTFLGKNFQQELNKMHSEINRESKTMQNEYDKETEHSVNTKAQEKWNKKISEELKSLNSFSSTSVDCLIK